MGKKRMILRRSLCVIVILLTANCIHAKQDGGIELKNDLTNLIVSNNNRYLTDANSTPIYLLGCTAWTMPENCTREDVDYYLSDRKSKGFNYVQVVAARDLSSQKISDQIKYGTMNPTNRYGFLPFEWNANNKADVSRPIIVEGGLPEAPNDYWDHLDYIVQKTAQMGMYIGILPKWGKYYINNSMPEMRLFTHSTAKSYGKFLGERYKAEKHIIWILGGDIPATSNIDGRPLYRSMAEGIAEGVTGDNPKWNESSTAWNKVLITYHGRNAAADYFNEDAWLKLNMIYDDDPELYYNVQLNYTNTPVRPIIEGEAWYEGWVWTGEYKTARVIRRQMYHALFGGALGGYVYGVAKSAQNLNDQVLRFQPGWKDRLDLEGATQVQYLKTLLDQHNWWEWEPDQSVITSGSGSGETQKAACKSKSGSELLVYFADVSSAAINLNKITSHQSAVGKWLDPRNGNTLEIGSFNTNQLNEFKPPINWEDAILILKGEDIDTGISGMEKSQDRLNISVYPIPSTKQNISVEYELQSVSYVSIHILNESGLLLESIDNKKQFIGKHKILVATKNYTSGIYVCYIQAENKTGVRKFIIE